ncbi:MAG: glycerophosphodiester phosphodiesterase [Chloroflexi bacterium]|nr:glycerophosphodiester phosphodiesterase [Chloroflexota bacterium]
MVEAKADYGWLWRRPGHRPLVVAHRGASGLAPENTLAAFRLALEASAPAVECDVHLSTDGVPVVIHDAQVDRTTFGFGSVALLSYAAVRRLDAGSWFGEAFAGERIPTLDEVLATCAGRARVFVELKAGGGTALVDAALAAIARVSGTEIAVISFDPSIVRDVATRRPSLPVGYLVSAAKVAAAGPAATSRQTVDLGAGFLSPQHTAASPALVEAAHRAGLPVGVWTVDDPALLERLAALGVDAITTNRPEIALRLLSERR